MPLPISFLRLATEAQAEALELRGEYTAATFRSRGPRGGLGLTLVAPRHIAAGPSDDCERPECRGQSVLGSRVWSQPGIPPGGVSFLETQGSQMLLARCVVGASHGARTQTSGASV